LVAAALVFAAGLATVASMSRLAMPASVWEVPATPTMGPVPGIPALVPTFNVRPRPRDAPAGRTLDLGDVFWVTEGEPGHVAMYVQSKRTWVDDLRVRLGGWIGAELIGVYAPTEETRDVDGTAWRRFEWKPR
jgi:hypothetical protein